MRQVLIPKGNGKFRKIYVPSNEEKIELRKLVGGIEKKAAKLSREGVVHGFCRGKSPITNALAHVGHKYSLSFDLANFFDTVTPKHVKGSLSDEELNLCFVDGIAGQGLPTSPAVANLAASAMDNAIIALRDKRKIDFIYTRYADDMTFSFDNEEIKLLLLYEIPQIVGRCGFKINKSKTYFQSTKRGNIVVTGVGIKGDSIVPTRYIKRKLRAALHQKQSHSAMGLAECIKLKTPRLRPEHHFDSEAIDNLTKVFRLPRIKLDKIPNKGPDEVLSHDCLITGDIAYTLGCSTYTTGWTSCLAQPNGGHRRSVLLWLYLEGTKVAGLLSDKTKIFGGIERRVLRSRCLVHTLRNGTRVYDRLYGNPDDCTELRQNLERVGIKPVSQFKGLGLKVVGNVKLSYRAWCDNLTQKKAKVDGKAVKVLVT